MRNGKSLTRHHPPFGGILRAGRLGVNRFESAVRHRRRHHHELREFHLKESVRLLTPFERKQREVEMETRYGFET
jgi:hypothetical protein